MSDETWSVGWGWICGAVLSLSFGAIWALNYCQFEWFARGWFDRPIRVLLVTAHPDDECMFFVPTVRALLSRKTASLRLVCLSTGNYDGLGSVRCRELIAACKLIGISSDRVHQPIDPPGAGSGSNSGSGGGDDRSGFIELPDGPREVWTADAVISILQPILTAHDITHIITFDSGGVSGHPNHIALHTAIQSLLSRHQTKQLTAYALATERNPIRKYTGPVDALITLIGCIATRWWWGGSNRSNGSDADGLNDQCVFATAWSDLLSVLHHRAMICHWSQYVWYRFLFVTFSRYTYLNTLNRIRPPQPQSTPALTQSGDRTGTRIQWKSIDRMDILDAYSHELVEEEQREKLTLNRIGFEPRALLWHTIKQYSNEAEWDELRHALGRSVIDANDDLDADVRSKLDLLVRAQIDNDTKQQTAQTAQTGTDSKHAASKPLPRNKFPSPNTKSGAGAATEIDRLKSDIALLLATLNAATAPHANTTKQADAVFHPAAIAHAVTNAGSTANDSSDSGGSGSSQSRQRALIEFAVTRDVSALTRPCVSTLRPASARPLSSSDGGSSRSSRSRSPSNTAGAAAGAGSSPHNSRPASAVHSISDSAGSTAVSSVVSTAGSTPNPHASAKADDSNASANANATGANGLSDLCDLSDSPLARSASLSDYLQPFLSRLNINDLPSIRDELIRAFNDEHRLLSADVETVTRLLDAEYVIAGRLALASDLTLNPPTATELQALKQSLLTLVTRQQTASSAAALSTSTTPEPLAAAIVSVSVSGSVSAMQQPPIHTPISGGASKPVIKSRTDFAASISAGSTSSGGSGSGGGGGSASRQRQLIDRTSNPSTKRVSSPLSPTAAPFVPSNSNSNSVANGAGATPTPAPPPLPPPPPPPALPVPTPSVAAASNTLIPSNHRFRSTAANTTAPVPVPVPALTLPTSAPPPTTTTSARSAPPIASTAAGGSAPPSPASKPLVKPMKRTILEAVLQMSKLDAAAAAAATASSHSPPPPQQPNSSRLRNRIADARKLASAIASGTDK